jgi:DNA-binding transcriptional MerR regulator
MNTQSAEIRKAEAMVKDFSSAEIKEAVKLHEEKQREARLLEIQRKLEAHQKRIDTQVETIRSLRAKERVALKMLAEMNKKLEEFKKGDMEAI